MKLFLVFAAVLIAVSANNGNEYKFEIKHEHHGGSEGGHEGLGSGISSYGHEGDHYHVPSYKFMYGDNDHHMHDHKPQFEHRANEKVSGEYTLDESDGTKRIVKYHADAMGFHAKFESVGQANL